MASLPDLQRLAIDYAKRGDFGADARAVNEQLSALTPSDETVWTRLGRCHAQANEFDAAEHAYRQALRLNGQNVIANNLLQKVLRDRQFGGQGNQESGCTGFGLKYFDLLGKRRLRTR